nr:glycosyltransferase [Mucilaginibacter straminoryzae]
MPYNLSSYRQTVKKLAEFKPDVVHIHNLHYGGSPSVLYAIKKFNVPTVVTLHNYRLLCPSATLYHKGEIFTDSIRKDLPLKAMLGGVYLNSKLLTAWVAITTFIHQKLGTWEIPKRYLVLGDHSRILFSFSKVRKIASRIAVKPNFCYQVENVATEKSHYYFYAGRITEEKGIMTMLEAFAKNGLRLKIAGGGPMEEEVKAFIKNHPNIEFLGRQNREQMSELLSGATSLIFPSIWFETFGMIIIEAFSAGTPVIASSLGQLKELINDKVNGLQFAPGNAEDLQEKIAYFESLTDEERQQYGENARRKYLENYTPEKNAEQLISIYQELVA